MKAFSTAQLNLLNPLALPSLRLLCLSLLLLTMTGCQSIYYGAMEKVGIHKRDILVDRVEEAKESQQEAKEQFKSALEKYQHVLNLEKTDLQEKYERINSEFEASQKAAEDVTDKINAIEEVADALFEEWNEELALYNNADLKRQSKAKLDATKKRYSQLMSSMRNAEKKMQPVVSALRDQTLFLKHNLNAQAISSLRGELATIQNSVNRLIRDMEKSIQESEAFIAQLQQS
jgi:prophage DNA circulation protein